MTNLYNASPEFTDTSELSFVMVVHITSASFAAAPGGVLPLLTFGCQKLQVGDVGIGTFTSFAVAQESGMVVHLQSTPDVPILCADTQFHNGIVGFAQGGPPLPFPADQWNVALFSVRLNSSAVFHPHTTDPNFFGGYGDCRFWFNDFNASMNDTSDWTLGTGGGFYAFDPPNQAASLAGHDLPPWTIATNGRPFGFPYISSPPNDGGESDQLPSEVEFSLLQVWNKYIDWSDKANRDLVYQVKSDDKIYLLGGKKIKDVFGAPQVWFEAGVTDKFEENLGTAGDFIVADDKPVAYSPGPEEGIPVLVP